MDYTKQINHGPESSPSGKKHRRRSEDFDSDTDFLEHDDPSDDALDTVEEADGHSIVQELEEHATPRRGSRSSISQPSPTSAKGRLSTVLEIDGLTVSQDVTLLPRCGKCLQQGLQVLKVSSIHFRK